MGGFVAAGYSDDNAAGRRDLATPQDQAAPTGDSARNRVTPGDLASVYNLTVNNLTVPANFAALKALLVQLTTT